MPVVLPNIQLSLTNLLDLCSAILFAAPSYFYAIDIQQIGKTKQGSEVFIDKQKVKVSSEGFFVFGLGRDRKYVVVISLYKDGDKKKMLKKIQKR